MLDPDWEFMPSNPDVADATYEDPEVLVNQFADSFGVIHGVMVA